MSDSESMDESTEMEEYEVTDCTKCPALVDNRNQIVNGIGDMDADIVFVGEAPGENEDIEGEPFVGRSGQKLTDMLNEAGLERSDVRITNTVRCRPPENRDPTDSECSNCRGYLLEEIRAVDPDYVIGLGATAVESLTGLDDSEISVLSNLGESHPLKEEDMDVPVVVCPHPAALIYRPSYRENVVELFEDFA